MRAVSARWNISKSSLSRHRVDCLPTAVIKRAVRAAKQSIAADPVALMRQVGFEPDPWQRDVLTSTAQQLLLLCCRQSGKSTVAAILALSEALSRAGSLTLLLSPSLRQSQELFHSVMGFYAMVKSPVPPELESTMRIELANGSRIISLPATEHTVRGYGGVDLLVIDEGSRVSDELYFAARPFVTVSGGRLLVLSTPFGKSGWFFDSWTGHEGDWERIRITAAQCPRITPDRLAKEKRTLPPWAFKRDFLVEFDESDSGIVFPFELIQGAMSDFEPLFVLEDA